MWEINNLEQWMTCFYSIFAGALICILYDILRLDRKVFNRNAVTVFFQDVFFWVVSAFLTFCVMLLRTGGEIRLYVLSCITIGFILCRLTLSKLIMFCFRPIKKLVRRIRNLYGKFVEWIYNLKLREIKVKENVNNGENLQKKSK